MTPTTRAAAASLRRRHRRLGDLVEYRGGLGALIRYYRRTAR